MFELKRYEKLLHICEMKVEFKDISLENITCVVDQIFMMLSKVSVVIFEGNLGSGKTTLVQKICERMGVTEKVTSPSYNLIHQYKERNHKAVYHFDFYRLNNIDEAFDLGFEEYLSSGQICLVEWADKVMPLITERYLLIKIEYQNHSRIYSIEEVE